MLVLALRASRRPVYDEVHVNELSPVSARNFAHRDDPIPLGEHATARLPREDALPPAAVLSQVNEFIEQRPAEVARLLRAWAEEGKELDVSSVTNPSDPNVAVPVKVDVPGRRAGAEATSSRSPTARRSQSCWRTSARSASVRS